MTTIGGKNDRTDLQSLLGYALTPPPQGHAYHPRPVHRLDRQISGLVLVAKTQKAMQVLSKAFVDRTGTKTYSAIVFEAPRAIAVVMNWNSHIHSTMTLAYALLGIMILTIQHPMRRRLFD
jgi:23S rRNA-/tRNA-specific pseudouridylate synthase